MRTLQQRFEEKIAIDKDTGCWNWTAGKKRNGYGHLWDHGKMKAAHRVAYELYCEPIPDEMHVLHKCDNPSCTNPDHLFVGTHSDNMRDRDAKERHGSAILSIPNVLLIREMIANGIPQTQIASEFGVSTSLVSQINTRRLWRHI